MAKAAPDGQQVNIPALLYVAMDGRSVVRIAHYWIWSQCRKNVAQANPRAQLNLKFKRCRNPEIRQRGFCKARFQEKLLSINIWEPYRKPTQVVRSRRPRRTSEMSPRNSAKKRPYLRYKACPSQEGPQLKYPWRLFIKNTAPCELVRGCIGGDTWPMPEGQTTTLCASHFVWSHQ